MREFVFQSIQFTAIKGTLDQASSPKHNGFYSPGISSIKQPSRSREILHHKAGTLCAHKTPAISTVRQEKELSFSLLHIGKFGCSGFWPGAQIHQMGHTRCPYHQHNSKQSFPNEGLQENKQLAKQKCTIIHVLLHKLQLPSISIKEKYSYSRGGSMAWWINKRMCFRNEKLWIQIIALPTAVSLTIHLPSLSLSVHDTHLSQRSEDPTWYESIDKMHFSPRTKYT